MRGSREESFLDIDRSKRHYLFHEVGARFLPHGCANQEDSTEEGLMSS